MRERKKARSSVRNQPFQTEESKNIFVSLIIDKASMEQYPHDSSRFFLALNTMSSILDRGHIS